MGDPVKDYLALRIDAIKTALSTSIKLIEHTGTKGSIGEEVVRDLITQFLPQQYRVGTGFVLNRADAPSSQQDILLFENLKSAPIFDDGKRVIVTGDMVRLCVECKLKLNKKQLNEAFECLESLKKCATEANTAVWAFDGMTLDTLESHLKNTPFPQIPDYIFNLKREYVVVRNRDEKGLNVASGLSDLTVLFFQAVALAGEIENLLPYVKDIAVTPILGDHTW